MIIRAKFEVTQITSHSWSDRHRTIILQPRYDDTIPEDRRFQEATPSGTLEMMVTNPAALAELTLGREFYLDFVPIDAEAE